MKIIINAISAKKGGIATYTKNLAHSFSRMKVSSVFAVSNEFELDSDVEKVVVKANRMDSFRRVLWEQVLWRKIIKNHKADILYSSANFGLLSPPVPQVLLLREGGLFDPFYLTNIGSLMSSRGIFERMARRYLMMASARSADLILTPSKTMRDQIISWDNSLKNRIDVNYYGTNTKMFTAKLAKRQWREDQVLKILYISAYYPHKQPGLIAEAVKELNLLGIPSHLTLTMDINVIKKTTGGEKDFFLLNKAIQQGQLTMVGNAAYSDLPDIYMNHDLFVFPSISETFGHPLAEAMSMGIPIIASDRPIHKEICGDAALYFSALRPSSLLEKIQLIDKNEALRKSLIRSGLENVNKKYIWDAHVDRLLDSFKEVLQK